MYSRAYTAINCCVTMLYYRSRYPPLSNWVSEGQQFLIWRAARREHRKFSSLNMSKMATLSDNKNTAKKPRVIYLPANTNESLQLKTEDTITA
jgi:hypothetical protein